MTIAAIKVKDICDEVYKMGYQQITIDLVQEEIEGLLYQDEELRRDDVGSASYRCEILLEVFNPVFDKDISLLSRLEVALDSWQKDIETTNRILGLPPES